MAKPRVLILCTGNSARSQMAEGLLRFLSKGKLEVSSAGTRPVQVHPLAIEAMREIGIDISGHRSKSVAEFEGRSFDTVITVCDAARDACPVFPGARLKLHFSFEDPAAVEGSREKKLAAFRRVRDRLNDTLRQFLRGFPSRSWPAPRSGF